MAIALAAGGVLSGPAPDGRAEQLDDHVARLGPLPRRRGPDLIADLEASGLLGRGGAGFPVGRKWRHLAERPAGPAVVVANGAEGEPGSAKDRVLMANRPHLVLDGAQLAAEATGADAIVVYVGSDHTAAVAALTDAIAERSLLGPPIRLVQAPVAYVAGEATAAVHYINAGIARPTGSPPRMSERGVGGRPTLVQNVESLAWAALIARHGPGWYGRLGRSTTSGSALVTLSGDGPGHGVREIEHGTTVRELVVGAGGDPDRLGAVVLGGYFGTWATARDALDLPLDPTDMQRAGLTFGCGMVGVIRDDTCGVATTARILGYLAEESARQCGPCLWGLRSIAETTAALAAGTSDPDAGRRLERWASILAGRGACRHPDGATQLLASALAVFADDVEAHARGRGCVATGRRPRAAS